MADFSFMQGALGTQTASAPVGGSPAPKQPDFSFMQGALGTQASAQPVGMGDVQAAGVIPTDYTSPTPALTPWQKIENAIAPPPSPATVTQRQQETAENEARQKQMYQQSPTARVLGSYLGGFANAGTLGMIPGAQKDYGIQQSPGEKIAAGAGQVLGSLPPIFASEALAGGPLAEIASKLGVSSRVLLSAIRGMGTFGGMGLVEHGGKLATGQETPAQAGAGEAGNLLFGAALGPAEEAISPLISKIPGQNAIADLFRNALTGAGGFTAGQAAGALPGIISGQQTIGQAAQSLPAAAIQGAVFGMFSPEERAQAKQELIDQDIPENDAETVLNAVDNKAKSLPALTGQTTQPQEGNVPGSDQQTWGLAPARQDLATRTPGELDAARGVLKKYKNLSPALLSRVWDSFPELQDEFPKLKAIFNAARTEPTVLSGYRNVEPINATTKQPDFVPGAAQNASQVQTPSGGQEASPESQSEAITDKLMQSFSQLPSDQQGQVKDALASGDHDKVAQLLGPNLEAPTQSVGADLYRNRFVPQDEFKINVDPKDPMGKKTMKDIQTEFTSRLNRDDLEGFFMQRDIKKLVPEQIDRDALSLYNGLGGNKQAIQEWIDDEDPTLDQQAKNRDYTYRDIYKQALTLDQNQGAMDALNELGRPYYDEAGKFAMETGATKDMRENYGNRIWEQRETGGPFVRPRWMETDKGISMVNEMQDILRSKDRFSKADRTQIENILRENKIPKKLWEKRFADIKNLMFNENQPTPTDTTAKLKVGEYEPNTMSPYTRHAKPRMFPNEGVGIKNGFTPATLDFADLTRAHVQDMSRVNNLRLLGDSLIKNGIGEVISNDSVLSKDWGTVMSYGAKRIVAPARMADAIRTVTEIYHPSGRLADISKGLRKFQGTIKTGITSYGLFHPYNLVKSLLSSTTGGIDLVLHAGDIQNMLQDQGVDDLMRKWVRSGMNISQIHQDIDVMNKLTESDNTGLRKVLNAPGVKQYLQGAEKVRDFTFSGMQTYFKTIDSELKLIDWTKKHPNASTDEVTEAMRSISRYQNANQGNLNWGALGVSPTVKNAMNLALLAPDWTASKFMMFKYALTDSGMTGGLARKNLATAFIGGALMTEMFNYICTGHLTNQNPKGHAGQVEVSPNTWWSFFPADVDDGLTVVNNTLSKGLGYAAIQELINKMAPLPSMFMDLAQQDYTAGKEGPVKGTVQSAETVGEHISPIPIGIQGDVSNIIKGQPGQSWLSRLAVGTGMARYQAPAKGQEATGQGQGIQGQLSQFKKSSPKKASTSSQQEKAAERAALSPLAKQYVSMSAANRQKFFDSLTPAQQQLLTQELGNYPLTSSKKPLGLLLRNTRKKAAW